MLCLHFAKTWGFNSPCLLRLTFGSCCIQGTGPIWWILHHKNRNIFTVIHHKNPIQENSNMEELKPISCSRSTVTSICSNILIVLENECLFALRCSCPQTLNLHSSCQIRWQFVTFVFWPLPSPDSPGIFGVHGGKKTTTKKETPPSPSTLLHLQIVHRKLSN